MARARAAAPGWAALTLAERLELLERAAPRLEAEVEALTKPRDSRDGQAERGRQG